MRQYPENSHAHKESGMISQIVLKYPEQPCSPEDMQDLSCPNLFLNREINWLDFNAKVLDEALSPRQPRNFMWERTKSSSSRSAIRSCIQRVARLPTVTSWAG